MDATKQTLPGASVYIEALKMGVTSDVNGLIRCPILAGHVYGEGDLRRVCTGGDEAGGA